MKSTDIRPFVPCGGYEINVGLKYLESNLKMYFDDYGLILNPDFQRGHVWTDEQRTAYMEFF